MGLAATLTERRKEQAIDQIARAALELIIRDGFDATSVETIAAAAGCSPRTVYRYFGTKEDLMFYDLPAVIEQIDRDVDRHLAEGLSAWAAVSEALLAFSRTVDAAGSELLAQRINIWLAEPALRGRYMQHFMDAERLIEDSLYRHRGTTPDKDPLPQLMAIAGLGAYRLTLTQHPLSRPGQKRTKFLRNLLTALGDGFNEDVTPRASKRTRAPSA